MSEVIEMIATTAIAPRRGFGSRLSVWAKRRPFLAAVATVAAIGLSGTAAYAYWTVSGSGSASGQAGTTSTASVITGSIASGIYPGGTHTVSFSATNTNTSDVTIRTLTPTAFAAFDDAALTTANTGGCQDLITAHTSSATAAASSSNYFSMQAVVANQVIPANSSSAVALTATGSVLFFNDPAVDQSACKGKYIKVSVTNGG